MTRPKRSAGVTMRQHKVACAACPLRQLAVFRAFEPQELTFVEWFKTGELTADAGSSILLEGHNSPHLFTILSGWAFRCKTLPDGRRQILSFALPGDFLGLQGPVLKEMQHSVEALTDVRLCLFPRDRLWDLYKRHPGLAHDIAWLATRAERMADNHLLSLGRRSAAERIAYLLLHLYNRCRALQLARGRRLELPVTQQHIADALGLSLVHTNKTLKALTRRRLVDWQERTVEILDEAELRRLAQYDETEGEIRPFI